MAPFPSVLIANRGEIACRVISTARRLGMRTIAVYSEADAGAKHVALADEAHLIGPAPARESYLVIEKIIEVAKRSGAASIHPGYGFLSERAEFAEACAAAGITFIGPPPSAIRAMGLKGEAKALMQRAGVPTVPGYHGDRQDPDFLREKAYEVGYPVLIKAVAGGGGKGMRRVDKVLDFDAALESAVREAKNAFGDGRVLVEKYVQQPRHVEIQVFGDRHGNVVHLFERDCSLQRRHQKVVEEAPAPGMSPEVRAAMGRAAVAAAAAVGYVGAGTVEFIADGSKGLRADGFWFMEMNTRLQVEHPVTEAITGLDLVELQLRVSAGEPLPFAQDDLTIDGHAVEARLYAEDPKKGFLPSTGDIHRFRPGREPVAEFAPVKDGVRIDSGLFPVDRVSPFYDPMIAKVIAHAPTREAALDRLASAIAGLELWGPRSNAAFLYALAKAPDFRAGRFDTGFIDAHLTELVSAAGVPGPEALEQGLRHLLGAEAQRVAALAKTREGGAGASPWDATDAFQLSGPREVTYRVEVDGEPQALIVAGPLGPTSGEQPRAIAGGFYINLHPGQCFIRFPDPAAALDLAEHGGDGVITAPMHGKLTALFVEPGQAVVKGDRLFIVEAMKMEHAVHAPIDGTVAEVAAEAGAQVGEGARLVVIEAAGG